MKCQRRLVQTQILKTPEKGSNENELINLPESDFKKKSHKHDHGRRKNIQGLRNEFRTEIHSLESTTGGFKSVLDTVKEMVNEKEIGEEEYKEAEAQKKRIFRNERILRELCDQSKWNNIRIIGVTEEEEREKGKVSLRR